MDVCVPMLASKRWNNSLTRYDGTTVHEFELVSVAISMQLLGGIRLERPRLASCSLIRLGTMRKEDFRRFVFSVCILLAIVCSGFVIARGETNKAWQSGTLIKVKSHETTSADNVVTKQYDITVQVGNKIYMTEHTVKDGEPDLEYYVGMARMVSIDGDTLTFNDLLGHPHSLRIISSKDVSEAQAK
jgi:hypothetical protein